MPTPFDREATLNILRSLKAELGDRYQVTKIGIFGSVARDEATNKSDIDIVVEMEPDMLKRISLKQELEEMFQTSEAIQPYDTFPGKVVVVSLIICALCLFFLSFLKKLSTE